MSSRIKVVPLIAALGILAFFMSGTAGQSALQNIELLDSDGNLIGLIFPDTPHVVLSQSGESQRIQISGFVISAELPADQPMGNFENADNLFYNDLEFQDVFGNSVRLIGVMHNDTETCFASARVEVSLWDITGALRFVDQFTVWQINPGDRSPFRSDRIFTTVEEANALELRLRFLEGVGCSSGSGGGGGGVGDSI